MATRLPEILSNWSFPNPAHTGRGPECRNADQGLEPEKEGSDDAGRMGRGISAGTKQESTAGVNRSPFDGLRANGGKSLFPFDGLRANGGKSLFPFDRLRANGGQSEFHVNGKIAST
jgi:hypothetical protein